LALPLLQVAHIIIQNNHMKRLFAAISLKPGKEFVNTYSELQKSLKHERITWVGINNMHLTLKFFGETEEHKIPSIANALNNGSAEITPFSLRFNKIGTFGSSYNPKVIWLGTDDQPILNKLAGRVRIEFEKTGFEYDRQNFVPHLTLGRIRNITDNQIFQKVMDDFRHEFLLEQEVEAIHLFESVLTPQGPIYTQLHSIALKR
jgi:RNA 2',3'-cyclic 3'-phosphodiesterase